LNAFLLKGSIYTLVNSLSCSLITILTLFCWGSYSEVKEGENIDDKSTDLKEVGSIPSLSLVKKQFSGRYAISSEEFTGEMVRF